MLLGGRVTLRGACGIELSAIVAGGPAKPPRPGPAAGAGVAVTGAVSCQSLAGPLGWTPVRFRSQSCAFSVGFTIEIASFLRSALSAATTSIGRSEERRVGKEC